MLKLSGVSFQINVRPGEGAYCPPKDLSYLTLLGLSYNFFVYEIWFIIYAL